MSINDNIIRFQKSVSVGIIWDKTKNKLTASFHNFSNTNFYLVQGQFLYFNKNRRFIDGLATTYKYLFSNTVLFDDFFDIDPKISKYVHTITFKPISVDLENPFISTSMQESKIDESKTIRTFDTDLLNPPNNG